jgi:hypothetical protein
VWIKRGVNCQADFVFGQGLTVASKIEAVNEVLQDFWDDFSNQAELTTPDALQDKDRELQLFGELFFAFFVNASSGRVQVRTFDPDTIVGDPICNPEDDKEPWFYKRVYQAPKLDYATGGTTSETKTVYHPDWRYNPASKPKAIGGVPIQWDAPVFHVKTGTLKRAKRGVPEILAQMDWGKVYTEFLANRATVARALSEIVRKVKSKSKQTLAKISEKLAGARTRAGLDQVGETALMTQDTDVEPVNVKGATIDPKEGEAFLCALAAGFGLPMTYFGVVDVGNHATAAALNLPTKIMFDRRRLFWVGVLTSILIYVVLQAAVRPGGKLRNKCRVEFYGKTPRILVPDTKGGEIPVPVDLQFPPYYTDDPSKQMDTVVKAKDVIPDPKIIARKALQVLGENDIDEKVNAMTFPPAGGEDPANPQGKPAPKSNEKQTQTS